MTGVTTVSDLLSNSNQKDKLEKMMALMMNRNGPLNDENSASTTDEEER